LGFAPGSGFAPFKTLEKKLASFGILTLSPGLKLKMSHRFQISRDSQALFITIVTKDRLPVFKTAELKEIVCQALDEARKSAGFLLFAYVIMVDHAHLLTSRPHTTSDVLRVVKSLTARRVIDYLKSRHYKSSLAKLQHRERDQNYKYSLWQTEKNYFQYLVSQSLWRR
jgi:REP-associated tyrosine transposase